MVYFSRAMDFGLVRCVFPQRISCPMCQRSLSIRVLSCASSFVAHGMPVTSEWKNYGGHLELLSGILLPSSTLRFWFSCLESICPCLEEI